MTAKGKWWGAERSYKGRALSTWLRAGYVGTPGPGLEWYGHNDIDNNFSISIFL